MTYGEYVIMAGVFFTGKVLLYMLCRHIVDFIKPLSFKHIEQVGDTEVR